MVTSPAKASRPADTIVIPMKSILVSLNSEGALQACRGGCVELWRCLRIAVEFEECVEGNVEFGEFVFKEAVGEEKETMDQCPRGAEFSR